MKDQHIIFVGLPGVGKTTAGRYLASRVERVFSDFDDEIVAKFGKSVSEIFIQHGELAFRQEEVEVSARWAGQHAAVLAPGGGWVANQEAVAHLRSVSRIIYLRATPTEALRRMGRGISRRPLFTAGDPGVVMQAIYEVRRGAYQNLADLVIDTDGLSRGELSARVAECASRVFDLQLTENERRI